MKIDFKDLFHFDADIEKLVEKGMDLKETHPSEKKTRYQIKQEEKRKNEELKQKHFIQGYLLMLGFIVFIIVVVLLFSLLGIE